MELRFLDERKKNILTVESPIPSIGDIIIVAKTEYTVYKRCFFYTYCSDEGNLIKELDHVNVLVSSIWE
jgi:hypothetical protein